MPSINLNSVTSLFFDKSNRFSRAFLVLAMVFLAIALMQILNPNNMGAFWGNIKSNTLNAGYTELAFDNPGKLPLRASDDDKVNFSFMIRNLEDKNMKYTYAVTDNYDDKTTVLTTKTIELKPGASAHQQQSITVQAAGKRQKISVVLIDQKETISFWIAAD